MMMIIIVGFCVMENLLIMYSCIFKVLWSNGSEVGLCIIHFSRCLMIEYKMSIVQQSLAFSILIKFFMLIKLCLNKTFSKVSLGKHFGNAI